MRVRELHELIVSARDEGRASVKVVPLPHDRKPGNASPSFGDGVTHAWFARESHRGRWVKKMMSAEELDADRRVTEHRPLPSVDVPLLPDELRASRRKKALLWGVPAACVGLGVSSVVAFQVYRAIPSWKSSGRTGSALSGRLVRIPDAPKQLDVQDRVQIPKEGLAVVESADSGVVEVQLDPAANVATATLRVVRRFGQAKSFHQALHNAGLSADESTALENALPKVMDFRRCRPEDQMTLERNEQGRLILFEYHARPTWYVQAKQETNGLWRASRKEVPVERIRLVRGGVVTSSLGDALEHVGLGRALVSMLVDTFEGKMDFSTATRSGDTFRIIVEEERIAGTFLRYGVVHALEYIGARSGKLQAFWFETKLGVGDFYDAEGRALKEDWLRSPLRYDRISSRFNPRRMHPILKRVVPHNGVDYAAGVGALVWAAADGTVSFAGQKGANGNLVSIRHDGGVETLYAHLSRIERGIRSGVRVKQHQSIGYVGSTGRSTGPHLHFSLKKFGRFVDPLPILVAPGKRLPSPLLEMFRRRMSKLLTELHGVDSSVTEQQRSFQSRNGDRGTNPTSESDEPMD